MSSVADQPDDPIHDTPMPLLSHLVELRRRMIWSAVSFMIAFIFCYHFSTQIYSFLCQAASGHPAVAHRAGPAADLHGAV